MIAIKGWAKFQHFKDRKPPWIKLYRDILDDKEWHRLDAKAAKALVMLWLIASESDGVLPDRETLAFRLRTTETEVDTFLSKLSHWLDQEDIGAISDRHQSDAPETEAEKRREEREAKARAFETFWKAYPKKEAKKDAEQAWAKVDVPVDVLLAAIATRAKSEDWTKANGQFVPLPATWLRGRRWEDVKPPVTVTVPGPTAPDPELVKARERSSVAAAMPQEVRAFVAQITRKTA